MELPEFMYGPYKEVKRRSNKILRDLKKGASWEEAVAGLPLLESKEMEGYIVIEEPNPFKKKEVHFYVYLLLSQFGEDESLENREEEIFHKHLETAWGTLSLMSDSGGLVQEFSIPPHRHIPFIKAAVKFWDIYVSEGKKFSYGGSSTHYIWNTLTNIQHVLARRGVPNEVLRSPLPNNDLEALVKKYNLI